MHHLSKAILAKSHTVSTRFFYSMGFSLSLLPSTSHAVLPNHMGLLEQHALNRLSYGATQYELAKLQRMGFDNYLEEQLQANQPYTPVLNQGLAQNSLPPMQQLANRYVTIEATFKQSQKQSQTLIPPAISSTMLITNPAPNATITSATITSATMASATLPITPTQNVAKQLHDQQRQQLFKQIDTATRNRRVLMATYDPNQLLEVMTDFWYNHFNIYNYKSDLTRLTYSDFEQSAIRPYALGKFGDLLTATAHHPAMLDYLDNRLSSVPSLDPKHPERPTKGGINENYAREIMELHTLGVNGGYSQADVTSLAKILTGWGTNLQTIAKGQPFVYNPKQHDTSAKVWLKQSIATGQQQEEGEQVLMSLAHSPATAQHISHELASYFIADNPPPALVKQLTQTFLKTDGDIAQMLRVIFHSAEFWQNTNRQQKFKSPLRYVISSVRNTELPQIDPNILANRMDSMGEPLYGRISPDGYDWQQSTWLSPSAIQLRLNFASQLASGKLFQNPKNPIATINYQINPTLLLNNAFADIRPVTRQRYDSLQDDVSKTTLLLGSPEFMNY